jgi:hypothetical protein
MAERNYPATSFMSILLAESDIADLAQAEAKSTRRIDDNRTRDI